MCTSERAVHIQLRTWSSRRYLVVTGCLGRGQVLHSWLRSCASIKAASGAQKPKKEEDVRRRPSESRPKAVPRAEEAFDEASDDHRLLCSRLALFVGGVLSLLKEAEKRRNVSDPLAEKGQILAQTSLPLICPGVAATTQEQRRG